MPIPRFPLRLGSPQILGLSVAIKAAWTAVALYVVARVTPLKDAERYLAGIVRESEGLWDRTVLMTRLAVALKAGLQADFLVHLVFSAATALAVWWLLRDRDLSRGRGWIFLGLLLAPAFGIWGSIISKEALSVVFACLYFRALLDSLEGPRIRWPGLLLGLAGFAFFRYHYAVGIAWTTVAFLVLRLHPGGPRRGAAWLAGMLALAAVAAAAAAGHLARFADGYLIPYVRQYILGGEDGRTTRDWLVLQDHGDLIANLWWGLPFSIVGPLPGEAAARPVLIPLFLGGCLTLFLYAACFAAARRRLVGMPGGAALFWLGLVPGALATLLIHYPFAVLNAGAGIRYHVAFCVQMGFGMLALAAPRARD